MGNIYFLYRKSLLKYFIFLLAIFCSLIVSAQDTITFQKPSELKEDILSFENKEGSLVKTFDLVNGSSIKKPTTQEWKFENSIFTIKRNKKNYTERGFLIFNNSHDNYVIRFKPNFSTNKIQRLQFHTRDTDLLVFDAICKYPYLTITKDSVHVELNNTKDTLKYQSIIIKNIGYDTLQLAVDIPKNDFRYHNR